jgi:predicted DNA-binding transcriptional regulator AlpA
MNPRKSKSIKVRGNAGRMRSARTGKDRRERRWVTGPALRKILNISSVTLWRWRRNNGFPVAKIINGRLYFPLHEVDAWLEAQPDAA